MESYCWQLEPFGWPCLDQSQWAAWIQVAGSFAALFLAIYVPLRMRRLEELERMTAVVECIRNLKKIASYYVVALPDMDQEIGTPPFDLETMIDACRTHLGNPATPAFMLPSLGRAIRAGDNLRDHWKYASSGLTSRGNPSFIKSGTQRCEAIVAETAGLEAALRKWRNSHRLTLIFS